MVIQFLCLDMPFILVGTKLDLVTNSSKGRCVSKTDAELMCRELDGCNFMQCSALYPVENGQNKVEKVFEAAIKCGLRKCQTESSKCTIA